MEIIHDISFHFLSQILKSRRKTSIKDSFFEKEIFLCTTKRQIANLPKIRYSNLENLSYSASKRGKPPGTTCFPGDLSVGADRMDISQE